MGGLTSKRRRSKKRKGSGLKGRERDSSGKEREREREVNRIKDRREEEERKREREERELAWVPCALVSGYTSSQGSEGRYSGKFRVMQHCSSLSPSCLLFLFLPFVHSLILLSCAYSPLTILSLRPSC